MKYIYRGFDIEENLEHKFYWMDEKNATHGFYDSLELAQNSIDTHKKEQR